MCGRYTITTPSKELAEYFGVLPPGEPYEATTDARPTNNLPIVMNDGSTTMVIGHWGYRMKIQGKEKELINVRAENILQKPFWKHVAKKNRCIVLADGFYEWTKDATHQKYRFTIKTGPMAFAGIYEWEMKKLSNEIRPFFSIITVPANHDMKPIHDRMPVILPTGHETDWISEDFIPELLRPYESKLITTPV